MIVCPAALAVRRRTCRSSSGLVYLDKKNGRFVMTHPRTARPLASVTTPFRFSGVWRWMRNGSDDLRPSCAARCWASLVRMAARSKFVDRYSLSGNHARRSKRFHSMPPCILWRGGTSGIGAPLGGDEAPALACQRDCWKRHALLSAQLALVCPGDRTAAGASI